MTKFDRTVRLRTMVMALRHCRQTCFKHAKSDYLFGFNLGSAFGYIGAAFWCELITLKQYEILCKWTTSWLDFQK